MLHSLFTAFFASAILVSSSAGQTAPAQKVQFTTVLPAAASSSAQSIEEPVETPTPTIVPTEVPTQAPVVVPTDIPVTLPTAVPAATQNPGTISDEALIALGNCEAGMNPARNSGNGYYGAFQFSYGTWKSMNTGYERADLAPIEVQKDAVRRLLQRSSIFGQFPGCARKMRAEGLI